MPKEKRKSIRSIAREMGIDHSTLSKIQNGKYNADPKNIIQKLLKHFGGVHVPTDRIDDLLEMLDNARFPAKFQNCQRTASWLYETLTDAKNKQEKSNE